MTQEMVPLLEEKGTEGLSRLITELYLRMLQFEGDTRHYTINTEQALLRMGVSLDEKQSVASK